MKNRVQFTPELTAALICAGGWILIWLLAFRPAQLQATDGASPRAELSRLIIDEKILDKLKAPTLFALPSEEGFSGRFIEDQVVRRISQEKPSSPGRYLPMNPAVAPRLNPERLVEQALITKETLPLPGVEPQLAARIASETQLFFSPELKARAVNFAPDALPILDGQDSIRANLSIRADGTIATIFFETPVTNAALLNAIRRLPFKPAKEPSEGWVDIRFAQKGAE